MLQRARGADLLITIGGASVGDFDLVRRALGATGFDLEFQKVAMQPGKPTIFGRLSHLPVLGLPGNPVSAAVTSPLRSRRSRECWGWSIRRAWPRPRGSPATCRRTGSARVISGNPVTHAGRRTTRAAVRQPGQFIAAPPRRGRLSGCALSTRHRREQASASSLSSSVMMLFSHRERSGSS